MAWDSSSKKEYLVFIKKWLSSRRYFFSFLLVFSLFFGLYAYIFDIHLLFFTYLFTFFVLSASFFLLMDAFFAYRSYRQLFLEREFKAQTAGEYFLDKRVQELRLENQLLREQEREKRAEFSDYFTLWAHQIKTPIAASQLILADIQTEERENLQAELFRIEQYADSVMQYLRLETFHQDLQMKHENLSQLVRQAVKKYSLFFIKEQISLELGDLEKDLITDKKWFAILLEQLLSNAIKYSPRGKIKIYTQEENLWIEDTGIGIKKSDLGRVFERGFSGYNGRLSQQSSGLGLYLVKRIADNLGHSLTLDSQIGLGTKVGISIKNC